MEPLAAALAMCVPMTSGPIPSASVVVDAFTQAYNEHDLRTIRSLVSADAEIGHPGDVETGSTVVGRYETIVFKRFPKVKVEVLERLAYGDLVSQTEHVSGISPEGETGLSVYRVDRGCIVGMAISKSPDQ